ncbi:MAG: hypothetical protein ACOY0T_03050 [Myxococcota bacterium]
MLAVRSALLALIVTVSSGCARTKKEPEPAPARPSADPVLEVCTALAAPGPSAKRFEKVLPLEAGGLVVVLGGTNARAVERALEPLGLTNTKIVSCGADDIILWVPAVDHSRAERLQAAVLSDAPGATVKDSEVLAPRSAAPPKRPRD